MVRLFCEKTRLKHFVRGFGWTVSLESMVGPIMLESMVGPILLESMIELFLERMWLDYFVRECG